MAHMTQRARSALSFVAAMGVAVLTPSCGCNTNTGSLLVASGGGVPLSVDCDGDGRLDGPIVGGMAWLDDNFDGVRDVDDPGVEGVTVDVFAPDGSLLATRVTDADGRWMAEDVANPYGVVVRYRDWPADVAPGFAGPNNGTDTQRVVGATCGADFALRRPIACDPNQPMRAATPCYFAGTHDGDAATFDGLVSFGSEAEGIPARYAGPNPDPAIYPVVGENPRLDATIGELGTTFGLAFQPRTQYLFAGAVLKRHSGPRRCRTRRHLRLQLRQHAGHARRRDRPRGRRRVQRCAARELRHRRSRSQ